MSEATPAQPRPTWKSRGLATGVVLVVFGIPLAACVWGMKIAQMKSRETALNNSLRQIGVSFSLYESKYKAYPTDEDVFLKFLRDEQKTDVETFMVCPICKGRLHLDATTAPGPSEKDRRLASHLCPVTHLRYELFFQGRVEVFQAEASSAK